MKLALIITLVVHMPGLLAQNYNRVLGWYDYEKQMNLNSVELETLEKGLLLSIDQTRVSNIEIRRYNYRTGSMDDLNVRTAYLVNNTDSTVRIMTVDGNLIMALEAKDSTNNWRPIESWIWSNCGNSYHYPLRLKQGQYVSFRVPIYEGDISTSMRLKLRGTGLGYEYSNEFQGYISEEQLYLINEVEHDFPYGRKIELDENGRPK